MSVGMPAGIWLNKFGVIVTDYFGAVPYHVGSSLDRKDWRDVDVRLILDDDDFAARFGSRNQNAETNPKLAAITLAFAALGKAMTGLPVDFQIQPQTWANEHYHGPRSALIGRHKIVQDAAKAADEANQVRQAGTWDRRAPQAEERDASWYATAIEYYLKH